MRIVIVGYGRMGRCVEEFLRERGHHVAHRVDSQGLGDAESLSPRILEKADGVIEFALAEGIMDRLKAYVDADVPAVVGTTGWDDRAAAAKTLYARGRGAILRGSNFSLGAHLFFRLTRAAARLLNGVPEYDVALSEQHHRGKEDAPSGTAITAAEGILSALHRKTHLLTAAPVQRVAEDALQIASIRLGAVPGIHEMHIDSPADSLTIRHEARSRGGFALGAVRGMEWLAEQRGWHEAEEFIDDLLKIKEGAT